MKSKQKYYLFIILMLPLFLAACSNQEKPVSLTQVYNNNTLQTRGSYLFDDGKLAISKEFTLSLNPNVAPGDIDSEKNKQEIKTMMQDEFPDTTLSDDLFQTVETTLSKIKIEKNEKEIRFTGKNYEKRFEYLDDSKKMVKDDLGIEYSVDNDE